VLRAAHQASVFPALAGGEHPGLRGELGRYVQHGLAVGDEPLGEVFADAMAAFHGPPDPVRSTTGHASICR
jgi:hypothetical protein